MRSTIVLITLSLSVSLSTFSQDSSFRLKDYKYRTKGYRALDLKGELGGAYYQIKTDDAMVQDQSANSFYFGPLSASYFQTFNLDKRIHTLEAWAGINYSSERRKFDKGVEKVKYFFPSAGLEVQDLHYKGSFFLETGYSISNNLQIQNRKDTNSQLNNLQNIARATITIGIGKGRIENVSDAQMAAFILDDLAVQGLLSNHPDAQTYYELASLITQINNKRVFDNRRRRIYELSQIDSFIRTKNLAAVTDIRHFTTINDNWTLANNPLRLSGKKIFFRVRPGAEIEFAKRKVDNPSILYTEKNAQKPVTIEPEFGFESYHPVNLHWQQDWGVKFIGGHTWNYLNSEVEMPNQPLIENKNRTTASFGEFRAGYQLSYFPNNRTTMSLGANINARYSKYDETNYESLFIEPGLGFSTNYFINYRTRLNFSVSVFDSNFREGIDNLDNKRNQLGSNLSLGITHNVL